MLKGYNKHPVHSYDTIKNFAKKFPEAGLAFLTCPNKMIVVDLDTNDPEAVLHVFSVCGYTPVQVQTKRGYHLYYRNPEGLLGASNSILKIDAKGARSSDFVVVPPTKGYKFISKSIAEWEAML